MSPAAFAHIALGVVATLLAALRVWSWTAVGMSLGASRLRVAPAVEVAVALLAAAALTAFVYAMLAAAGALGVAVAIDSLVAVAGSGLAGGRAASKLVTVARALMPAGRAGSIGVVALVILLWAVAIGPPRDADVLHYHLAHIRQIITDGVWRQLPICAYGPPFGWSLTFLPFVWLGVPQAAHLVNTATWLLAGSVVAAAAAPERSAADDRLRAIGLAIWLGATLLPQSLKAATTAMVDSMMVLVIATVLALLARREATRRWELSELIALGFVTFVAFNSRLQTGALVAAVLLVVIVLERRAIGPRLLPLAGGAALALLLAAPFYVANALTFETPFWPVAGVSGGGAVAALARECAGREFMGVPGRIAGIGRLLRSPGVFPIPLIALGGAVAALARSRGQRAAVVPIFIIGYFAAWWIAQPSLTPRYAIYLLPAAVLLIVPWLASMGRAARVFRIAGSAALGALALIAAGYSLDYLRLVASGNVRRFHQATWYWDTLDWVNRNTPEDARVLAILYGGQTYHLNRWNRSADVGSSAVVDWLSVPDGCALAGVLEDRGITHVLHHRDMWRDREEGRNVSTAIAAAREEGVLLLLETLDAPLVVSRMLNAIVPSRVDVYEVDPARARTVRCTGN